MSGATAAPLATVSSTIGQLRKPAALTAEQVAKVDKLSAQVEPLLAQSPISEALRRFCNRACVERYLRSRQWNYNNAAKALKATLAWRESTRPELITYDNVAASAETGRVVWLQRPDRQGRPVLMMRLNIPPAPVSSEQQINFLIYHLDLASRVADEAGVGKMAWLLDMQGYCRKFSPPFKVSRQTINILQAHYPERLGHALVCRAPSLFEWFYSTVSPFLDPVTKEKVRFIKRCEEARLPQILGEHFDMDDISQELGGNNAGPFDPKAYEARLRAEEAKCRGTDSKMQTAQC